MGSSPPLWLMMVTVGAYVAFFLAYGEEIIDPSEGVSCTTFTGCVASIFGFIGDFFQLITLGGFDSPLPTIIQAPLLILFAFAWGKIIVEILIEGYQAVVPL